MTRPQRRSPAETTDAEPVTASGCRYGSDRRSLCGSPAPAVADGWYDPHQNPPTCRAACRTGSPAGWQGKCGRCRRTIWSRWRTHRPSAGVRGRTATVSRSGSRATASATCSSTRATAFRPDRPMEPGRYTWQVRRLDSYGRPLPDRSSRVADPEGWSTPRIFEVRQDGINLSVPPVWDAFDRAKARKRPRSLPADPASGRFDPALLDPRHNGRCSRPSPAAF